MTLYRDILNRYRQLSDKDSNQSQDGNDLLSGHEWILKINDIEIRPKKKKDAMCIHCGKPYKGEKRLLNHSKKCDAVLLLSKGSEDIAETHQDDIKEEIIPSRALLAGESYKENHTETF